MHFPVQFNHFEIYINHTIILRGSFSKICMSLSILFYHCRIYLLGSWWKLEKKNIARSENEETSDQSSVGKVQLQKFCLWKFSMVQLRRLIDYLCNEVFNIQLSQLIFKNWFSLHLSYIQVLAKKGQRRKNPKLSG